MKDHPFFSIIIPLYNKENYIQHTLNSIIKQSFNNFEIIIINDGSTDQSLEKVNCFFKNNTVTHTIINQQNKGLPATRNKGIAVAKGTVIALIDADDLWHNNCLQAFYDLYKKFPTASFYGLDYIEKYSDNNSLETKKNIPNQLKNSSLLINDFFLANKFQSIVCQSSIAFKRALAEPVFFNEEINYAEDVDFYLKYLVKYKLAYHYKAMATILCNVPGQITKTGIRNKTLPNLDKYEKLYPKNTSLKKYLDFKRYMYASQYKIMGDTINFNKMVRGINFNNLSKKQKFLLKCPVLLLKLLKKIKSLLLKNNIRVTTFT